MGILTALGVIGTAIGAAASTGAGAAIATGATIAGVAGAGAAIGHHADKKKDKARSRAQQAQQQQQQAHEQQQKATSSAMSRDQLLQGNTNILGNTDGGTLSNIRGRLVNV